MTMLSSTWNLSSVMEKDYFQIKSRQNEDVTYTKYDVSDISSDFMMNDDTMTKINDIILKLEEAEATQNSVNKLYDVVCDEIRQEMDKKLNKKGIIIKHGLSNKRRRIKIPWWSDHLTVLWNRLTMAEEAWRQTHGPSITRKKADMCDAQREIDRCVRSVKCRWWRHQQESLLVLQSQNATEFWWEIGQFGVNNNQKSQIQWRSLGRMDLLVRTNRRFYKNGNRNLASSLTQLVTHKTVSLQCLRHKMWRNMALMIPSIELSSSMHLLRPRTERLWVMTIYQWKCYEMNKQRITC